MLGGDERWPQRNFFQAAKFGLDVADHAQEPEVRTRPKPSDRDNGPARHQQRRQCCYHVHEQIEVEQKVKDDRANDDHARNPVFPRSSPVRVIRRAIDLTPAPARATRAALTRPATNWVWTYSHANL